MIRVKLLSEEAYSELQQERRFRSYDESQFHKLLQEKGDFTDKESLSLLRHLHGEAAVTGKWYRSATAEGEPCLPAISREAMYGLVVIENSRKGLYTPIEEDFTDYEVRACMGSGHNWPRVWKAFANMELDILLTYHIKDLGFAAEIPLEEEEFILENYPLNGTPTDVHVVPEHFGKPELRDGEWYIHNSFYDLRYKWTEHTEKLLKYLREDQWGQPPLAKGVYSWADFENMCWPKRNDRRYDLSRAREEREEAEALGIPYEGNEDPWRVINHMAYLPEEGDSRRLLYLIIEEFADGRFCLRDEVSVKYPTYDEMVDQAMGMAKEDCEVMIVPVDVDEIMRESGDIWKAVCAFRVVGKVIETFGPKEGLWEFEKVLRRAVESGMFCIEE